MDDKELINELLPMLNCALRTENEHFCQEPLLLSCGHHICKGCLRPEISHNKITCNFCNELNNKDLNQKENLKFFQIILKANLKQLFTIVSERFNKTFQTCADMIKNNNVTIEQRFEFIKEEMQIRVESCKIELDDMYDSFIKELEEMKERWIEDSESLALDLNFDEKNFVDIQNKLEENIKKQEYLNNDNLYYYQNQIKKIQDIINEYNERTLKIAFKEDSSIIKKQLMGLLIFKSGEDHAIIHQIKNKKYKKVDIEPNILDATVLPNRNILLTSAFQKNLLLYDHNMKFLKKITTLNNKIRSVTSTSDYIFMSDSANDQIIKTNLEFTKLAVFGRGAGSLFNQVNGPKGICYYKDYIFVCDLNNTRILKLERDLSYNASFPLDFKPWYIKNVDNVALIRPVDDLALYFYDLNNFNILKKHENHNGIIGVSKSSFYEYYPENKTFYIYKKNGQLFKSIETDGFGLSENNTDGSICVLNSKLYLQNFDNPFMIII